MFFLSSVAKGNDTLSKALVVDKTSDGPEVHEHVHSDIEKYQRYEKPAELIAEGAPAEEAVWLSQKEGQHGKYC